MSQHHQLIRNDPRWKAARAACLSRDGFACVVCGATADQLTPRVAGTTGLQADHIIRLVDGGEPFDLDNLQTLCESCHEEKEREYDSRLTVRVDWINPRYPELGMIINKECDDGVPVF